MRFAGIRSFSCRGACGHNQPHPAGENRPATGLTKRQWVTGIPCDGANVKGYERLVRLEWWGDRV
jgi:hypothetical protein